MITLLPNCFLVETIFLFYEQLSKSRKNSVMLPFMLFWHNDNSIFLADNNDNSMRLHIFFILDGNIFPQKDFLLAQNAASKGYKHNKHTSRLYIARPPGYFKINKAPALDVILPISFGNRPYKSFNEIWRCIRLVNPQVQYGVLHLWKLLSVMSKYSKRCHIWEHKRIRAIVVRWQKWRWRT